MFLNRQEAGQVLARKISEKYSRLIGNPQVIVLGIARGGVAVAAEVARILKSSLDVLVVRKLGVPGHEELAFGAVSLDGRMVLDNQTVSLLGLSETTIEAVRKRELLEAERREKKFRFGRGQLPVEGRVVILVDDGIATGATSEAALNYLRTRKTGKVILATPVITARTSHELKSKFQRLGAGFSIVSLQTPENFAAVGQFYRNFSQTSDEEVLELLAERN